MSKAPQGSDERAAALKKLVYTDSDRARAELGNSLERADRDQSTVLHKLIGELAKKIEPMSLEELAGHVEDAAAVSRRSGRAGRVEVCPMISWAATVMRLLPPFGWERTHVEQALEGCVVDLVFQAPDLLIVGEAIGDIVFVELKRGGHHRGSGIRRIVEQREKFLATTHADFAPRLLGVATLNFIDGRSSVFHTVTGEQFAVPEVWETGTRLE